jgi:thymidine kinase
MTIGFIFCSYNSYLIQMEEFRLGHLEVVCGPMFSGKSEELIRRLKRVQISGKKFLLFKPAIDNRYDANHVVSHDQRKLEAIITGQDRASIGEIERMVENENPDVIAFDEGNFYDLCLTESVKKWIFQGKRVIVAGLDSDFRGEPFGPMPYLMAIADYVDKLKAICMKCKSDYGTMTQRLVNGQPARYSDPVILVGGFDSYETRCRNCHEMQKG